MMSHHPSEPESGTADSVSSSPRSDHLPHPPHKWHDDMQPRVRFMCSFGGRILPRPHDNQLRYVGGDTRIVAVHRTTTYAALLSKLSKLSALTDVTVKYQLPNEDLDALISVTTDEDVENMMEEYDRLTHGVNSRTARLRLFLFSPGAGGGGGSAHSSISSILDGSTKRARWFLDALNGGGSASLERGRSEVSSIVSEVPDYLFGLDNNSDEREPAKPKNRPVQADSVSVSDPGSPFPPATSSPYFSSSSATCIVPPIPDLPPVKTKPEIQNPAVESRENQSESFTEPVEPSISQPASYTGNPVWQFLPDTHYPGPAGQPVPVYYVQGPVSGGNVPLRHVPMPAPYVQQIPAPATAHIPMGYRHAVPGVNVGQAYDFSAGVIPDGVTQQVYYAQGNAGMISAYQTPEFPPEGISREPVRRS